jgi:hypothetical protein
LSKHPLLLSYSHSWALTSIVLSGDRTRPPITVRRSVTPPPPRLRPLLLPNSLIEVQLRKSLQGLSDPPDECCYLPPGQLLKKEFKSVQTKDVRSHHLSWDALRMLAHRHLGIDIDLRKDELGWMQVSRLGAKYIPITDELTFHNAIGVLHNASVLESGSLITVYLWSPRLEDPAFRRSRRAPDVPPARGDDLSGVPGKQDRGAPQPTPPRYDNTLPLLPRSLHDMMPASAARRDLPCDKDDPADGNTLPPPASSTERTPPPPPSSGENTPPLPPSSNEKGTPERAPSEERRSPSPSGSEIPFDVNKLLQQESQRDLLAPEQEEDEDDDEFQARLAEYRAQLAENETNRYGNSLPGISFR